MNNRISFFLCFCVLSSLMCATSAYSKEVVGIVKDTDNDPISFATIAISFKPATLQDNYQTTDVDGIFKFTVKEKADSVQIILSSLGYKKTILSFDCQNITDTLNITMEFDTHELSEVVVKGNYYGITERGDTTVFSVSHFADGSEHNIGDVIRKMPGMSVDANGKVSYQGQNVDKILINGKDIFSNPDMFVNSLPSDFASKLELIDNYSDGNASNGFNNTSRTALNLKSSHSNNWNGQLSASGGIDSKYSTENSFVGMHKSHSLSGIIKANNTGASMFSILDYLKSKGSLESLSVSGGGALKLSDEEQRLLLPPDNEFARSGQLGSLDYSYSLDNKYKLKVGGLLHHTASDGSSNSVLKYIDTGYENKKQSSLHNNNLFLSLNVVNNWNISEHSTFLSQTSIDRGNYSNNALIDNIYSGQNIAEQDFLANNSLKIKHEMTLNHRYKEGIFYALSHIDVEQKDKNGYMETPLNLSFYNACGNQDRFKYQSACNAAQLSSHLALGFMYPLFGTSNMIKTEISYRHVNEVLSAIDLQNEYISANLKSNNAGLYLGIMKNSGLFRYSVGIHSFLTTVHANNLLIASRKRIIFEPYVKTELYFSKRHRLSAGFDYNQLPVAIEQLVNTSWIIGNNSFYVGSLVKEFYQSKISSRLSYRYISLFDRLTMFAIMSHSYSWNGILNSTWNEGISQYRRNEDGGKQSIFVCQGYLNKGIGSLPLDISMSPKMTKTRTNIKNTKGLAEASVSEAEISSSIKTKFRTFPINLEISGNYGRKQYSLTLPEINSETITYGTALKSILNLSKSLNMSIVGKWNHIDGLNFSISRYDVDFEVTYKYRRMAVGFIGRNVFNLRNNSWVSESVSATVLSQSMYQTLPGYLMAHLQYSF